MLKKKSSIIIISIIIFYIIFSIFNYTFASNLRNELYGDFYNNSLASGTSTILGVIKYVGIAICVGMIIYNGIKYVTTSPEGKADVKKDIIMIVVGMILLILGTEIIDIIYKAVNQF